MFFLANLINRIIYGFIKILNKGNGYTLPGYMVLKLFPNILNSKQFNYKKGIILISGTNGKTTTSKLVADILKTNGFSVVHNSSGSNLLRGIVTTLLLDINLITGSKSNIAVLEVDEFVLPTLLKFITPKVLVLLNLSRDQLDRYGETDTILSNWVRSLQNLSTKTTLVLDSTQDISQPLSKEFKGTTIFFNDLKSSKVLVNEYFNIKNINCSLKVASLFNLGLQDCLGVINNFEYAYGRGEVINFKDKSYTVYLAKNPASLNNNLEMLIDNSKNTNNEFSKNFDSILFILNDNIPDGRDISWIYDVNPAFIKDVCNNKNIFVSGSRCFDIATRLHYAVVPIKRENINKDINVIIDLITRYESTSKIVVLPNYSSMLSFRKITLGKNIL